VLPQWVLLPHLQIRNRILALFPFPAESSYPFNRFVDERGHTQFQGFNRVPYKSGETPEVAGRVGGERH